MVAPERSDQMKSLEDRIAFRADHLTVYQGKRLARRYLGLVERVSDPELKEAVALGYHKLLSYKDEYEVARLLSETAAEFTGELKLHYHLAPPMLSKIGADGRPRKVAYGAGIARLFPWLAKLKHLRGTPFDPFGYTAERRMERRLIRLVDDVLVIPDLESLSACLDGAD